jgi:xanthine dehydrogenase accessory factor
MDAPGTDRSSALRAERVPFVHARVVLAERPTSAKPGDEALVLHDGTIEGFVGGTCAEATVRDQSLRLLQTGESLLLRITPEPEPDQSGKMVVHNHCLSGGTIEIFLEPELPVPMVVVAGDAPIARALVVLGNHLGYDLRTFHGQVPPDASAVVVASHGRDEEPVLQAALDAGVGYVGLVASPRRGSAVVASLDVDEDQKQRIDVPAGLDIGARTPEEVALSILAGIIEVRPRPASPPVANEPAAAAAAATDPVCGMTVATVDTSLHVEHDGGRVWFCGIGCQKAFTADPAAFGA